MGELIILVGDSGSLLPSMGVTKNSKFPWLVMSWVNTHMLKVVHGLPSRVGDTGMTYH